MRRTGESPEDAHEHGGAHSGRAGERFTTRAFAFSLVLLLAVIGSLAARSVVDDGVEDDLRVESRESISSPVFGLASRWDRDLGAGAVLPQEAPSIPIMPGGVLRWADADGVGGRTGWQYGYLTEEPAAAVGLFYLDYFEASGGWALLESVPMGIRGTGWGGVLVNEVDPATVMVFALPSRLLVGAGPDNPTRVHVVHVTGEQAVRDMMKHGLMQEGGEFDDSE